MAGSLLLGSAQAQSAFTLAPSAQELLQRVTGGGQVGPDVLLGSAPADLLATLPSGSRVIGTVTYRGLPERGPSSSTVYFDSALSPSQVLKSFATTLGPNWKQASGTLSPPEAQGGFQKSAQLIDVTFYRTTPPQILRVSTQVVGAVTQVSLSRQEDENVKQILPYLAAPPPLPPGFLILPRLSAPEGGTVNLSGTANSGDGVIQTARIETKLSRQAVMDHYAAQLRQAGWTLTTQANAPVASSTI